MKSHKISNLKWYNQVKASSSAKQKTADMLVTLYNGEYYEAGAPDHIAKAQKLIRDDAVVAHMAHYAEDYGPLHGLSFTPRQADAEALKAFNQSGKTRSEFWRLAEKAGRFYWGQVLDLAFQRNESIKSTDGRGGKRDNVKPRQKAGASHKTDKTANHSAAKVETATELTDRSIPKFKEIAPFVTWLKASETRPLDGMNAHMALVEKDETLKRIYNLQREIADLISKLKA